MEGTLTNGITEKGSASIVVNATGTVDLGGTEGKMLKSISVTGTTAVEGGEARHGRLVNVGGNIDTSSTRPVTLVLDGDSLTAKPDDGQALISFANDGEEHSLKIAKDSLSLDITNTALRDVLDGTADEKGTYWMHIVDNGTLTGLDKLNGDLRLLNGENVTLLSTLGYMLTGDGMDGNIGLTGTSADVYLVLDGGTTGRAHEVTVGENSEALENSQAVVVDEDTKLTLKFGKDTTDTDVTLNNLVGLEGSTLEVTDGRSEPEEGELEHVTVDLNNATADITDETGYGDGAVNDEEGHTVTTDGTDGFGVKGQDTTFEGTIKSSKDTVDFTKSGDGQLTLGSATTKKGGINVAGDLKLADGGITVQGGSSNKLGSLTFGYDEQTPGESTVKH